MKFRTGNKDLIRHINRSLVINEIIANKFISRTDIAKNLELGLSTVTNIIEELKKEELVFEVGEADSTGGRKPILVQFNSNWGYVIGLKIEENQLKFVLTNLSAEIVERVTLPFVKGSDSQKVMDIVIEAINGLIKKIPEGKKLVGIGVAISGLVDSKNGLLIYSGMLGWKDIKISSILEEQFKVKVYVDNDVNAYTLAELWYGYGKTLKNFIVVTFGSGVGSGIVLERKLFAGDFGGAGEIGHMVIAAVGDARRCECGQRGCLEAYASENFIVDYIKENIQFYNESVIDLSEDLSIEKVFEYAKKGDMLAINAIKLSSKYFGYGLLNVINLLNISNVVLAGEGMVAKDIILPVVKDIVKDNFFHMHREKVHIEVSNLGDEAWEIGAATLVVSKFIEIPIYEHQAPNF